VADSKHVNHALINLAVKDHAPLADTKSPPAIQLVSQSTSSTASCQGTPASCFAA
jgi:hypothetical protein